jgi:hypothetical protein
VEVVIRGRARWIVIPGIANSGRLRLPRGQGCRDRACRWVCGCDGYHEPLATIKLQLKIACEVAEVVACQRNVRVGCLTMTLNLSDAVLMTDNLSWQNSKTVLLVHETI